MATSFSSLPILSLQALKTGNPSQDDLDALGRVLYDTFATTGFAYLVDFPLSFSDDEVFGLAKEFFTLPTEEKMKVAKRIFCKENKNTYRGYFPTQPHLSPDNLKEGLEIGPAAALPQSKSPEKVNLLEPNVWPSTDVLPAATREKLEQLHDELQSLASTILSVLATALGKPPDFFAPYLVDSLSTLRLLHYPSVPGQAASGTEADGSPKLSCSPHTDSGILTLLHQDPTGGLEVRNAEGQWVPAPYVKNSIVVNIGDLMAMVSGGRFVATMHRVRAPKPVAGSDGTVGRFSVPFFFEPGEQCVVKSVDGADDGVVYGPHVREKMKTWVEFQEDDE